MTRGEHAEQQAEKEPNHRADSQGCLPGKPSDRPAAMRTATRNTARASSWGPQSRRRYRGEAL